MFTKNIRSEQSLIMFAAKIIEKLLESIHCSQHYRVEMASSYLRIRESTQNPPIERRKKRFEESMKTLQENGVFNLADGTLQAKVDDKDVSIPFKKIDKIDLSNFFKWLGIDISSKPDDVDNKVWTVIPNEIKLRWDRFSDALQQHIVTCCAPNAEQGFNQIFETKMFGQSMRSPITFDVPKIPVRLPNDRLPEKVGNELYDLMDILKIEERDPANPKRRRDPMTRDYFDLKQVVPDKEAYEKIFQNRPT